MEYCKVCGRKNPLEEANFCYYCGASLKEGSGPSETKDAQLSGGTMEASADGKAAQVDETRVQRPFSTWRWLGMLLLLLIPPYGWIVFLVIALVSAFGANATEERRSFAKAFLIFLVVAAVVIYLTNMYIRSHPELMEQYNKLLGQLQAGS